MAEPKSATVEVLTAEVRVLMVGSRQVTLSVYDQLDRVAPEEIDPFGRVRPKSDSHYTTIFIMGMSKREKDAGALVRSSHPNEAELKRRREGKRYINSEYFLTKPEMIPESMMEKAKQWAALPLIVLAGLR